MLQKRIVYYVVKFNFENSKKNDKKRERFKRHCLYPFSVNS